ncbi:sulfatase-like hydrolase/transferase [Halomicroarcula sp. GCM10025709]|uniref:sulfatase-like hydrolase/transferase n=1 Tax=Halomicroarcula sp. GCM10025709 TaxID=3252669 RepID=UPI00361E8170
MRQADALVERLLGRLRDDGVLDETLVVICGDHGDGFGRPGLLPDEPPAVSHIVPMHETLLYVPLVVRPPGGGDGRRCHRPAALTAFPSVVESALDGEPIVDGFARDRVLTTKQPVTADLRERFEDACVDPSQFLAPSRAVYRPDPDDERAVRKRYYWGRRPPSAASTAPEQSRGASGSNRTGSTRRSPRHSQGCVSHWRAARPATRPRSNWPRSATTERPR